MKNILSIHSSLLLTLLVDIGLSSAHNVMKSKVAPAVINEYSIQPSTTSVSSLLVPGIQNLVLLTTLSALGMSTPALIGIGIMTSKVQASSFNDIQGMSPDSRIDGTRRRRAHPRDISVTGPDTDDKNSNHVAEVLVQKFAEITGQVTGWGPEMESPTSDALGRGGEVKGEFLDVESDLNVLKSDLKNRQDDITVESQSTSSISKHINKRQDGNVLLPKATSLVPREPNWAQFWKNLEHGCVGYGTNWNGKDCGDE